MTIAISGSSPEFYLRAKKLQRTLVLPEGSDSRCFEACKQLTQNSAFKSIYILDPGPLTQKYLDLKQQGASLELLDESSPIISKNSSTVPTLGEMTAQIIESNVRAKGRAPNQSQIASSSKLPLFQAGALVKSGIAQCALAGMSSTTSDVIRAALSTVGLAQHCSTVSGSFFMSKNREVSHAPAVASFDNSPTKSSQEFMFGDCGVVVEPTKDQLVDIAYSTSMTWKQLSGKEPVVAFLSFSTKASAVHEKVDLMRQAFEQFKSKYPTIESEGELQFDAAFSAEIGARKAPGSLVPGRANVYIFPDLGAANIAYKIAQRLAGFEAYGPILQGLSESYSDLSRGATVADIIMSAYIGALRSV